MPRDDTHPKRYDAFISYTRNPDKKFAEQLYHDLQGRFKIWWDQEAMESRGRTFLQEIRDAIWQSDRLIAVVSPRAVQSDYVCYEWEYAQEFAAAVLPILRDGDADLVNDQFGGLHFVDFKTRSYEQALKDLTDKLSTAVATQGDIWGAPDLPPFFVPRKEDFAALRKSVLADLTEPQPTTSKDRITALHGRGGSGKSSLALAFARKPEVRRAFPEGVIWVEAGRSPDVRRALKQVGDAVDTHAEHYRDIDSARYRLTEQLADKRCLIVVDDVWDTPFLQAVYDVIGPRCRLLVTTRIREIVLTGATVRRLHQLHREAALRLLSDWSECPVDQLPREAHTLLEVCDHLPIALAMCGALVRNHKTWPDVLDAVRSVDRADIRQGLPEDAKEELYTFRPLKVSLEALSELDERESEEGERPTEFYRRYLELAALPGGAHTPESVLIALWTERSDLKERHLRTVVNTLAGRALLRLEGETPPRSVLLHNLAQIYINSLVGNVAELHRDIGIALLNWWRQEGRRPGAILDEEKRTYVTSYLFSHLLHAQAWDQLATLLADVDYIKRKQTPEEQYLFREDIGALLENTELPADRLQQMVERLLAAIMKELPLSREQADWLDTFGYWLTQVAEGRNDEHGGLLWGLERKFDLACGGVSRALAKHFMGKGDHDWALRYAELETWVYQRAGDFERTVKACRRAESLCLTKGIADAYRLLARVEFVRMRARALATLARDESVGAVRRWRLGRQASKAYGRLNELLPSIGINAWEPTLEEWHALEEDSLDLIPVPHIGGPGTEHAFKARVVSAGHDCLGAMRIICLFLANGAAVEWLHHRRFREAHLLDGTTRYTVLLGGPKTPGISEVAGRFYHSNKEQFLRMASGLYFGAVQLKTTVGDTDCYMLGGISKVNTIMAAWRFSEDRELLDSLGVVRKE